MRKIAVWFGIAVGLSSVVPIAAAQVPSEPGAVTMPAVPQVPREQQLREFGAGTFNILNIGASQFVSKGLGNASFNYYAHGYVTAAANNSTYWAPVVLPSGARVRVVDLFACDTNSSTSHVTATLTGYSGIPSPATGDYVVVTSTALPGNGCGHSSLLIDHTISNDVTQGGSFYVINLFMGAADSSNRFKGVNLWWTRQVSPAPATASFADVPTEHWAFQFIEALRSSSITTGCGTGVYCPDNNVTRAEMAVFLSRALGLHWPF